MKRQLYFRPGLRAFSLLLCLTAPAGATPNDAPRLKAAVAGFTYTDTSGEQRDQTAAHAIRLKRFNDDLREGLKGVYRLAPLDCGDTCPSADTDIAGLLEAARRSGADHLVFGGVHKMSTLVQWTKAVVVDVRAGRVVVDRLLSFRGDSDEAWRRAAAYAARDLAGAASPAPAPIKLAMFQFELEDFSAAAQYKGKSEDDAAQLERATGEARRLLEESGRYTLLDTAPADAAPVKAGALRHCNGCDAHIAAQLQAQQSFVGVITRINRTEYTVYFTIRDARTGSVVSAQRTDLRMGANYSWNRGVAALIKRWLQESQDTP